MLERAAGQARRMFDLDLAARLARAALEAGGGVGAGLVLGEAEFRSGRHAEAEQVLAGLVPICRDDTDLALVANARAYNFGVLMGDYVGASAVVDEALGAVSDPGLGSAWLRAKHSCGCSAVTHRRHSRPPPSSSKPMTRA